MANGFSITISAVNNASGVLEKINKNLTAMQAPAKNFGKQVEKFKELSGLRKVSQGFDSIVRSSLGAARSVTRVAEPLAAITGAASIAGFTALLSKWAEFNTALGFSAQRMGIMPQTLGNLRAAGSLAGGSADAMQTGFDNLGQTLYDVANGQAPQAAYVMSRLGLALTDAGGRARKAQDVMPQLADAIAGIKNPLAQARLATMLFGSAGVDMLPVLRQGSAGLERLRQLAIRYGGTTNEGTAAALRFSEAQAAVGQSVVGLTDAIATQLAPAISPLLLQFADWISGARKSKFITHDLAGGVKDFGNWIKQIDFGEVMKEVKAFGAEVVRILGFLTEWKNRLDDLTGNNAPAVPGMQQPTIVDNIIDSITGNDRSVPDQGDVRDKHGTGFGRFLYSHFDRLRSVDNWFHGNGSKVSTPSSAAQSAAAQHAMAIFQSLGWTRAQSAGLAANGLRESGFNPAAVNGSHFGAYQWDLHRQANFAKWAGFDIHDPRATLDKQLEFKSYELTQGEEQAAGRLLRQASGANLAGAIVSSQDLRTDHRMAEMDLRGTIADTLFNTRPAGPSAALSADAAGGGGRGAAGATGRVDVNIIPPPGTKVVARATGNVNTPRIATAMPAAGPTDFYEGSLN